MMTVALRQAAAGPEPVARTSANGLKKIAYRARSYYSIGYKAVNASRQAVPLMEVLNTSLGCNRRVKPQNQTQAQQHRKLKAQKLKLNFGHFDAHGRFA
jgi:cobalamin biosynthesis protein CbiG